MTRKEYNGWTNYETWAVALWLDNDRGSSDSWTERATEALKEAEETPSANARMTGKEIFTTEEKATFQLADALKDYHEENSPLADAADVYTDLLNAALSEVDWQEIAEHYIEKAQAEAEESKEETTEEE